MNFFEDKSFKKWCWIELIGFDNTSKDFGVQDFLDRAGFVPTGISLLISWLGFVFEHEGLDNEKKLNDGECSYVGHRFCPERERQSWTNYQLKGLVDTLHAHGIKVYIGFFNYCSYKEDNGNVFVDPFHRDHPEVREKDSAGSYISTHMLKRLSDGTYYEDVVQDRTVKALVDYGFDGVQIADGISSPRLTLASSLYRDDILAQFEESTGITVPENEDVTEYILKNCYLEFAKFCTSRWNQFFAKFYEKLYNAGKGAHFNSAWTSCPFDSIYRYGVDYRGVAEAGARSCVVEDVSGAVTVLAQEYNGYLMTDEQRRRVTYWFIAKLMLNKATMKNVDMLPIANIHDNMEQWGVYEHLRTYMTTVVTSDMNSLIYTDKGTRPVIDGPWYNLCDSLEAHDWEHIRGVWNKAYTPDAYGNAGVTLVWSNNTLDSELQEFNLSRRSPTTHLLSELLYGASPVNAVVNIDDIDSLPKPFGLYSGALLVINSDQFSKNEFEKVINSKRDVFILTPPDKLPNGFEVIVEEINSFGGLVLACNNGKRALKSIKNDAEYSFDSKTDHEPLDALWTHQLAHKPYSNDFFIECGYAIQELTGAPSINRELTTELGIHRRVCKYICVQTNDVNRCKLIMLNDDYWYNCPTVTFERKIKNGICTTKYHGYKLNLTDYTVSTLVPLKGAEIINIEFE